MYVELRPPRGQFVLVLGKKKDILVGGGRWKLSVILQ